MKETERRRYYVPRNWIFMMLLPWVPLLSIIITTILASSTTAASSSSGTTKWNAATGVDGWDIPTNFPLPGVKPDIFVTVAPMIVGVVCNDGVLLVALHTAFSNKGYNDNDNNDVNNNHHSFLLWKEHDILLPTLEENNSTASTTSRLERLDIPKGYRGPFRIYPIDGSSTTPTTTAMVCAGWRSDGQRAANSVKSIHREESSIYGNSVAVSGGGREEYGSYLASRASQMLARYAVSSGVRPLSCVSLMATSSSGNDGRGNDDHIQNSGSGGYLWLIDATGAYRVRAHAVGGGVTAASQMNDILAQKDWTKQNCDDTARELLQVLFDDDQTNEQQQNTTRRVTDILPGTLVEIAAIVCGGGKLPCQDEHRRQLRIIQQRRGMKKLFASTLFGRSSVSPVAT
jgi:20S proteasome alpha/beta subunit